MFAFSGGVRLGGGVHFQGERGAVSGREGRARTGNDEEGLGGVGEAAEDAADGPEQRAAAVGVAQQQHKAGQRDGAVREQVQQRCAVTFPKLLCQVQRLPPELRLQHQMHQKLQPQTECLAALSASTDSVAFPGVLRQTQRLPPELRLQRRMHQKLEPQKPLKTLCKHSLLARLTRWQ